MAERVADRAKRRDRAQSLKPVPVGSAEARWILLLPSVPDTTTRVRIWRKLQTVGAVLLKNSVYVLPNRDECVEAFQWVARELAELGGQASLFEGQFFDGVTDEEIERRFVEARDEDFQGVAKDARALAKALKAKRLSSAKLAALESQVGKLKRRLDEIVLLDFCGAPGREPAEGLVNALSRTITALRGKRSESEALPRSTRPRGATWVTRVGVHVDRVASAWLIRRFVDPEAKLKFVSAKGYLPEPGELRFDMYDAEFTHVGDRCTFEVLIERMGLDDPALVALGEIVHDIDLRDEKYHRPETAGVESMINGICLRERDDLARIAATTPLLEGLYAFFSMRSRNTKRGSEA